MKQLVVTLLILVIIVLVLNKLVFTDITETQKKEQIASIKPYVHPINNIEWNKTDADYAILDTILKDNKIIMLGECGHEDGQTMKEKSKIIKYLHEHLGYNVVLYEAGLYDCTIMNQELKTHQLQVPNDSIMGIGLFHFWWGNLETDSLNNYYLHCEKSKCPIELGGFDIQLSGKAFKGKTRELLLKNFLSSHNINIKQYPTVDSNMENILLLQYRSSLTQMLNEKQQKNFLQELKNISKAIDALPYSKEQNLYARYLHDINTTLYKTMHYEVGANASMHFRDSLMAKNLFYQIDSLYKNEKIIVWCANVHTLASSYAKDYIPLGAYVKQRYGTRSYMLDCTSYGSQIGQNSFTGNPCKLSIENSFHAMQLPYFILNLRDVPNTSLLKKEFYSTINQGNDEKRRWSDFVDGIFYIDINSISTIKK